MKLRYMIIGAGGVGGPVGAYLSKSGADTTLIARGKHLAVLQEHGDACIRENERGAFRSRQSTWTAFSCREGAGAPAPDVIFVCVRDTLSRIPCRSSAKAAGRDTVVIPVLNIYGTGRALQAELPELLVTDGCIYISANRIAPGVIQKRGAICVSCTDCRATRPTIRCCSRSRLTSKTPDRPGVFSVCRARHAAQICVCVAECACGQYHAKAAEMQHPGEVRDSFVRLIKEVVALADKMGIPLESRPGELVERNLRILDALHRPRLPLYAARDMEAGKQSEVDGLIYQVVRLAEQYGVDVPEYRKIAEAVKNRRKIK